MGVAKPTQVGSGMNFPVAKLIELLEPAQWEEFTEEWATSLKSYKDVERWSGPGDMSRDIVAFTTDKKYDGPWDNYQCKRYALKLQPNHVWVEFGKMVYYTFKGEFSRPANYYFAASKGVGLKLQRLLSNPKVLREELIKNWDAHCKTGITDTEEVELEGPLLDHLKQFDFTIFKYKTVVQLVSGHANTIFHTRRFGTASISGPPGSRSATGRDTSEGKPLRRAAFRGLFGEAFVAAQQPRTTRRASGAGETFQQVARGVLLCRVASQFPA